MLHILCWKFKKKYLSKLSLVKVAQRLHTTRRMHVQYSRSRVGNHSTKVARGGEGVFPSGVPVMNIVTTTPTPLEQPFQSEKTFRNFISPRELSFVWFMVAWFFFFSSVHTRKMMIKIEVMVVDRDKQVYTNRYRNRGCWTCNGPHVQRNCRHFQQAHAVEGNTVTEPPQNSQCRTQDPRLSSTIYHSPSHSSLRSLKFWKGICGEQISLNAVRLGNEHHGCGS